VSRRIQAFRQPRDPSCPCDVDLGPVLVVASDGLNSGVIAARLSATARQGHLSCGEMALAQHSVCARLSRWDARGINRVRTQARAWKRSSSGGLTFSELDMGLPALPDGDINGDAVQRQTRGRRRWRSSVPHTSRLTATAR
jgi:hypothetical protein